MYVILIIILLCMIVQDNNIAYHTLHVHVHVYVCGYRCKEHDIVHNIMVNTLLVVFNLGVDIMIHLHNNYHSVHGQGFI